MTGTIAKLEAKHPVNKALEAAWHAPFFVWSVWAVMLFATLI